MVYIQLGLFGKTSQELFHQITGWISEPLFNPSQTPRFQCLVLEDGGGAGVVRSRECDFGWRVLDAQYWGVPQRRKRIFIVADFRGQRSRQVLFKPEGLRGHFAPSREKGKETAADHASSLVYPSTARTLTARHDSSPCADRGANVVLDCRGNGNGSVVNTLTGDHQSRVTDYTAICIAGNSIDRQPHNGGNGLGMQEEVAYTLTAKDRHAVGVFVAGAGAGAGLSYSEEVAPTLKSGSGSMNNAPSIVYGFKSFGEYEQTEIGKTLMACDDITTGDLAVETGKQIPTGKRKMVRRLTPIECERLQGYPDEWTKYGHDGKKISDSARYTGIGNSLALPCIEYLISGIAEIEMRERGSA